ncbi:hypothetical protein PIB30_027084 [Stylosanthes scabra]|uniref:Uncharacterized protein n=1 Tax=Stylosanthes scabra TaxID=79078 RepID=A0ABU6UCC5_9FABA|nr:hypothetical protein [Stylosanthes scabra]
MDRFGDLASCSNDDGGTELETDRRSRAERTDSKTLSLDRVDRVEDLVSMLQQYGYGTVPVPGTDTVAQRSGDSQDGGTWTITDHAADPRVADVT